MGFDLSAVKEDGGEFHFGAFSWPVLLEACGYLFPYVQKGARWHHAPAVDPLVTDENPYGYRLLGSNDNFCVSEDDAKLMARVARNFAALNDPDGALAQAGFGVKSDGRPDPIRADFIEKIGEFAEWAEQSGGFYVN